ncbi:hypothetical protein Pmar_PMAR021414 [Perkinsus marinus ATCC 50983]|uniref:Uncharacterized protein n=1 Tax=Perkinsus marinus (strain ATCC 50983 / TXsc) TaxID=423536 RepID=C5KX78_PERM5|nr:hypothetical protein Pmar_PMAR021414 [Perkinsus marinus ATCC 50983]EER10934.1 hypothetical protein Pmar_PMAR021414 [Perkinsus marinus ATCC 50983]|eukprot:XP_002779139.1 hypothetical protein Pmar_PMAR021414 [Perkinsus marinus ATCC 50983]
MLIKPVIRSIDTAEVRASSEGEDSPSLNEGLASTGIVFHRHQLKRMAAVPSPGALKDITNTGSAENEDCDNHEETLRVLRPEPKKIVGENSPDSMQSNSRIYEESESKDYSAFQQYLDIGRRSTTTSGPTGEEGLFMFEGQSCYEEVVICTIPFGVVVGAPRSSASLLSTFYIVKFSGEVAAPGFIEFGQAGILSTVKLAE